MNKSTITVFVALVAIAFTGMTQSNLVLAATDTAKKPDPNRFNRLLPPKDKRTPVLSEDGIHDKKGAGIKVLQEPKEAFSVLIKGKGGNHVDWVKSLNKKKINPLYDLEDPTLEPMTVDMNIVREVKGTMPDVVFPHEQHTQWLECNNCHPAIFIPQKGANPMSMVDIMLGNKCGVCHGSVAFPVTDCRRCHSKAKPMKTSKKAGTKNSAKSSSKSK